MLRSFADSLLGCVVWGLASSFVPATASIAGDRQATQSPTEVPGIDGEALAGIDAKLGDLEAIKLVRGVVIDLSSSSPRTPSTAGSPLWAFCRDRLSIRLVGVAGARDSDVLVATRIVRAVATLTASEDAAFAQGPAFIALRQCLLDLVGRGSRPLREAVVDTMGAFVDVEKRSSLVAGPAALRVRERPLVDLLGALVDHNPPPSAAVLEDVAQVLWRREPKRFLGFVMAGIQRNRETSTEGLGPYVTQLRERLGIDFPGLEEWEAWWQVNQSRSVHEMLEVSHRKLSADVALAWRQTLRRLREAGDGERLLAELHERLRSDFVTELRLAAVAGLGDFADWAPALGAGTSSEVGSSADEARQRLLWRACHLLVDVAERRLRPYEAREVRRAALAALRRYAAVVEVGPDELRIAVESAVLGGLEQYSVADPSDEGARAQLLELVRASGALGTSLAQGYLEAILADRARSHDIELLSACASSLGRLAKRGLSLPTAQLLIRHFEQARRSSDKAYKEFTRTCLGALNARPEDAPVADLLRDLFSTILSRGEEQDLRVAAILGLGTLAQQDPSAIEILAGVLSRPEDFETQELIAAVDAIAYVGERESLDRFLPLLKVDEKEAVEPKDKAVAEHLRKKVIGLVKARGAKGLARLLHGLEGAAWAEDSLAHIEYGSLLAADPEIEALSRLDKTETAAGDQIEAVWEANLFRLEASLLLNGSKDEKASLIARMGAFLEKSPQLRQIAPAAVGRFEAWIESEVRRDLLVKVLAAPPEGLDARVVLAEVVDLIRAPSLGVDRWRVLRWIERQLGVKDLKESRLHQPLVDLWLAYLRSDGAAQVWVGAKEGFRERYFLRIEALKGGGGGPRPRPAER
jgi:hypothetical protein